MSFAENLGRALGRTAAIVVKTSAAVAEASLEIIDDALYGVADKKMDKIIDARKAEAMKNDEYAEIQKRRDSEKGTNGEIVLSSPTLPLEDWMRQMDIEDEVAPEPLSMNFYRFLYSRPIHRGKNAVKHAVQRLVRSWDDKSVWSLDTSLCAVLGAQLNHLADNTHGMPINEESYPTFEDWQNAIRENAKVLIAYGNHWNEDLTGEEIEKRVKEAQRAMHWVADNLPALWD